MTETLLKSDKRPLVTLRGKNNGGYRIFLYTQYSRDTYVYETWLFIPICSKLSIISLMTSSWKWLKHSPITITVLLFSLKWCKGYNWVNLAIVWLFWNKFGIFRKKKQQKLKFTDFSYIDESQKVITNNFMFYLHKWQILSQINQLLFSYGKIDKIWQMNPSDLDLYLRSKILACIKHFRIPNTCAVYLSMKHDIHPNIIQICL